MVQNPKGGGLSSSFGGDTQQIGGVKKTTDFLDKTTWILASLILVLILFSNITLNSESDNLESELMSVKKDLDLNEKLNKELEAFGFYLSEHPTNIYKSIFPDLTNISLDDFQKHISNSVPCYHLTHELGLEISDFFCKNNKVWLLQDELCLEQVEAL